MHGAQVVSRAELPAPFWRRCAALAGEPRFLLDSALVHPRLGRHSLLGAEPFATVRAWRLPDRPPGANALVRLDRHRDVGPAPWGDDERATRHGDLYVLLRELLGAFAYDPPSRPPSPFGAGAVGYFAYEAGHHAERHGGRAVDDLGLPDVHLLLVDAVACHDAVAGTTSVAGTGWARTAATAHRRASDRCEQLLASLAVPQPATPLRTGAPGHDATVVVDAMFGAAEYGELVECIKDHLRAGDAYEVCLTHRLSVRPPLPDPWALYGALRSVNPAPFAAFVDLGSSVLVSSSPERFLSVDRRRHVESRPIKGTRPRGATPTEDQALHDELARSVKDRAENMMIVDLVRNDLGRVCEIGSVEVSELMAVERYATLFQMVSTVRGRLEGGRDALDAVRAAFPGGSMTGAPKIEAMKIIDRLEPVERGIYSGSIGYLDVSGAADLNIVIRTLLVKGGRCFYNVGGAVVADSDPFEEYDETMDKAHALELALAAAAGR